MVDCDVDYSIDMLTESATKDWRKLLQLGQDLDLLKRRTLLWVWPSECEIQQFGNLLRTLKIDKILSVGCGNGLLEWILRESLNIKVYGLEVDRCWWQSKYAVKNFIELNYIENLENDGSSLHNYTSNSSKHFLQKCCRLDNWEFCLMFCYFNNRSAFLNYLQMYKGEWLIIIGPCAEVGVYTDPLPLEPHFPAEMHWQLQKILYIGAHDVVAFYNNTSK